MKEKNIELPKGLQLGCSTTRSAESTIAIVEILKDERPVYPYPWVILYIKTGVATDQRTLTNTTQKNSKKHKNLLTGFSSFKVDSNMNLHWQKSVTKTRYIWRGQA